jgi:hypothetical protein
MAELCSGNDSENFVARDLPDVVVSHAKVDTATSLIVCMKTFMYDFAARAGVAQWPEQMIRNHQVVGSTPIPGSRFNANFRLLA